MSRRHKSFNDTVILEMIEDGTISAEGIFDRDPVITTFGNYRKPFITYGKSNPRYFLKIHRETIGKIRYTRNIARSKLVWMIWHRRVIPMYHHIHHRDEDRFNDAINNLQCILSSDHYSYHYGGDDYFY